MGVGDSRVPLFRGPHHLGLLRRVDNRDVEGGVLALSPDGDEDVCWSIIRTRKQDIRLIALKQQSICNQFGNGGDFMGSAAFLSFAITVLVLDTLKQQSIIPS